MSSSTQTQNTTATKTYDVHTTGFGYLNDIRIVTPKHGGNPYLSCNINLQEGVAENGDYSKINKIYFQANVVGSKAKALIHQNFTFDADGKCSPAGPVTASVRLGGINVETFIYKNGDKAGQTGVALKTRLLKINWLSIGDDVIEIDDSDDESTQADQAQTEPATAEQAQADPVEADSDQAQSEEEPTTEDEVAAVDTQPVSVAVATNETNIQYDRPVRLDKDDPNFEAKKAKLKQLGYRWNPEDSNWLKPLSETVAVAA